MAEVTSNPSSVTHDTSGVTFIVEDSIKPETQYGGKSSYRERTRELSLEKAWSSQVGFRGSVEAMSPAPDRTVAVFTRQNLFAKAVHAAFYGHHRLILSPDVIWITIAQGLANHVDQNAEELRDKFVDFDGKKNIEIERPGFVKGSKDNDWPGVFPEFCEQIAKNTKNDVAKLIQNNFSTSGPVERIASQITLMDVVKHYFTYSMACGCGFPSITLKGTPADWKEIRAKAEKLRVYGLDWWLEALLPALDEFVSASEGKPDLDFWRSLCNINTGTSFPILEPLTGWVQVFFPYLIDPGFGYGDDEKKKMRRNEYLSSYVGSQKAKVNVTNYDELSGSDGSWGSRKNAPEGTSWGVKLENFPPGLASAPFVWKDVSGIDYDMGFYAGITCLAQDTDGGIEPRIGWAVLDTGKKRRR